MDRPVVRRLDTSDYLIKWPIPIMLFINKRNQMFHLTF
ncbi:hypothetical protein SHPE106448_05665 [Shewanella pealeana]